MRQLRVLYLLLAVTFGSLSWTQGACKAFSLASLTSFLLQIGRLGIHPLPAPSPCVVLFILRLRSSCVGAELFLSFSTRWASVPQPVPLPLGLVSVRGFAYRCGSRAARIRQQ